MAPVYRNNHGVDVDIPYENISVKNNGDMFITEKGSLYIDYNGNKSKVDKFPNFDKASMNKIMDDYTEWRYKNLKGGQ